MAEGKAVFHEKSILDKASLNPNRKLENESSPLAQPLKQPFCPQCNSNRLYKDGFRYLNNGSNVQRWMCRECSHRFSDQKPLRKNQYWQINTASTLLAKRQVCDLLTEESKNLAITEDPPRSGLAGATEKTIEANSKNKLFEFAWWMKKEGYSEHTITTRVKLLKILTKRGANLLDHDSVKETIAKQTWCNKRKVNAADAYTSFLNMLGLSWEPPRYKIAQKLPFIPTETEIDQLVAGCSRKLTPLLQLLKETGVRIGEACNLTWLDIDTESGTLRVTPEKGSRPRAFKVSSKLKAMLIELRGTIKSEIPFPNHIRNLRRNFQRQRQKVAARLQNPRLLQIHFHTFRHWKATMEYHKTKDILHVMHLLGHKSISNTLIYTQLIDLKDDEYVSKVATTSEEACKLVEAGFEHVCELNNSHIFRKRK